MKIIVASSSPPDRGSGINTYARIITEELLLMGNEIHYLSPTPSNATWFEEKGIHHISCGQDDEPLESARKTLRYIRANRIDGAINNDNSVLQSIAPALSCPVIAVGHLGKTNVATLACHNHQWIDYVIAISSDMQQTFVGSYNVPVTKCPIIHNGVPDPGVEVRKRLHRGGTLKIVFGGGMDRRKGGYLVHRALSDAVSHWRDIELNWFGNVPEDKMNSLRQLSGINFHGLVARDRFLEILADADVLLLPSSEEGCPMIMLEAMSYGVVPVASNGKGAMRWLVDSGRNGFICHLKDWSSQMMDCLCFLRDHPVHLLEMRKAARCRYVAEYQSSATTERMVSLLRRPTIDRSRIPERIEVHRWHRPTIKGSSKAPLLDRIFIRLGRLRLAGVLNTSEWQN